MPYTPPSSGATNWDTPLNAALADINDVAEEALAKVELIRSASSGLVATQETTSSTSYTDLATAGPACSVTLDEARPVLVLFSAEMFQVSTSNEVRMSFAASGATTLASADARSANQNGAGNAEVGMKFAIVACSAGVTTFTAKYRCAGGTGRFENRVIAAVPL